MKVTAFLHYELRPGYQQEAKFVLFPFDMSDTSYSTWALVGEVVAEVPDTTTPTKEFITHQLVTRLNKDKQNILAETHQRVSAIEQQIQNLLCLTNTVEVSNEDN